MIDNNNQYTEIELQIMEEWESIGICNDFVFCKVMQDQALLEELVRFILPDLKFESLRVHSQETIEIGMDIHGVRFDIFTISEDGTVIEIEMQVISSNYLPKRLRYYESTSDMQILQKGKPYSALKDSYIIMICPFDYYEAGRHIYTFTNICKEDTNIKMGDGTTKIFLNANGTMNDIDDRPKLKAFLDYVAGTVSDDEYVQKLDEAVKIAKANKKWRREYMTLMMRDLENQEIGKREGIEIGAKRGQQETAGLMNFLWSHGRGEDAIRAGKDENYLNQLLKDYNSGSLIFN